jgi:hypothetical protein
MMSHRTSGATCRGTWTRGVGEVVDDEPVRGEVVNDEPRDVLKQPDARHRKIDSASIGARPLALMDFSESTNIFIFLTRVLRIRSVVMITPT